MAEPGRAYMVECADICCVKNCNKPATHTVYSKWGESVGRFCLEDAATFVSQAKGDSMADNPALDAFRWLREFEYNAQYFAQCAGALREALGNVQSDRRMNEADIDMPHRSLSAADFIDGLLEHCDEMRIGLVKLREIANG